MFDSVRMLKYNSCRFIKDLPKIMRNANASEARVFDIVALRQGGICRFCKRAITRNDEVVSSGKNKKYYHKQCAEKLNII